ncbi:MAG: S1 RNA-binding domain-containing protein, partial [bacterium]|nr:S1 RNA-binding domain-containing protein [bacterium]
MAAKTSKTSSITPAQTMDQLLAKVGYEPKGLVRGQKIEGVVVEVLPNMLILDIGAKSEGLVVDREYDSARGFIRGLKAGDRVSATVVVPEREDGQAILSVRDSAEETGWGDLELAGKEGRELEVRVEDANRGGLSIIYNGIEGFVPSSHMGSKISSDPQLLIGKIVKVKIIEIDKENKKLVLSERAVSEAEILEAQQKAISKVKEGDKYKGKVVALVSFGAFVQIEIEGIPVDGLVHVSELSWQKVSEPSQAVKEGDAVEVVVIGKPSKSESTGGGS